jgi:hypothetical protein
VKPYPKRNEIAPQPLLEAISGSSHATNPVMVCVQSRGVLSKTVRGPVIANRRQHIANDAPPSCKKAEINPQSDVFSQ